VVAVPYDFRRGVADAAKRLDAVVKAHLGAASEAERAGRVVVLGHSMGGLVARYWMGPMGRWPWCRALLTVGTPHRGAPKALDWMVNGVRVLGVPLPRPTRLLREWPSVAELLPRYRAVRDTATGQLRYPHELPCEHLGSAAEAYRMHCVIEDAWNAMPRSGPELKVCLGWSHATPDDTTWDGQRLTVTKRVPDWLERTGWERDFGDGTVPAVSAVPIELSHHNQESFTRLRDRHVPMAGADILGVLLRDYLERRPVDWIRGDGGDADHPPALGLDLDELHGAGQPVPLTVTAREVDADLGSQPVWASVTPVDGDTPPVKLDYDTATGRFTGELPAMTPGLYEVTVSARAVPGAGDLSAGDTIAVIDPSAGGGGD
jgi:Lecithin:cholesterol acyltransferase